jgi:hypothetical protein
MGSRLWLSVFWCYGVRELQLGDHLALPGNGQERGFYDARTACIHRTALALLIGLCPLRQDHAKCDFYFPYRLGQVSSERGYRSGAAKNRVLTSRLDRNVQNHVGTAKDSGTAFYGTAKPASFFALKETDEHKKPARSS